MSAAPILAAFRQSLVEAWARGAGALLPLGFLGGAAVLVPLGIGSDGEMLKAVGPGIIWVALALASLVTLERIFQSDAEDGTLDLWLQTGAPVSAIAAAKTLAHWLSAGLPLALFSPLLALMFQAEANTALLVNAGLYAIGSLAFFFWGGVGAALGDRAPGRPADLADRPAPVCPDSDFWRPRDVGRAGVCRRAPVPGCVHSLRLRCCALCDGGSAPLGGRLRER